MKNQILKKLRTSIMSFPGTELVGPSYRVLAGFLIQGFYSIGYMALSGVAYLIYDWRYIEVAITLPVVLFAAYLW